MQSDRTGKVACTLHTFEKFLFSYSLLYVKDIEYCVENSLSVQLRHEMDFILFHFLSRSFTFFLIFFFVFFCICGFNFSIRNYQNLMNFVGYHWLHCSVGKILIFATTNCSRSNTIRTFAKTEPSDSCRRERRRKTIILLYSFIYFSQLKAK